MCVCDLPTGHRIWNAVDLDVQFEIGATGRDRSSGWNTAYTAMATPNHRRTTGNKRTNPRFHERQ